MASADWIPIAEAARRLTAGGDPVERSSLSRYVKRYELPTRKQGRATLVEFAALAAHRSENIRLETQQRDSRSGQSAPATDPGSTSPIEPKLTGAQRKSLAEAEIKEMELAKLRGELVPTAEVDRAKRDAIALMQSAFDKAIEASAADASLRYGWDERQARLVLKAFGRSGLEAFHRHMLEKLDELAGLEPVGSGVGDAGAGLTLQ